MCQSIYAVHEDREIESVGELRQLVGGAWMIPAGDGLEFPDDGCLCCVRIPETLIWAGFKVWHEPGDDPMRYCCEPVSHPRADRSQERMNG